MRHQRAGSLVTAALAALALAAPASAAAEPVRIDLHVIFLPDGGSVETFSATGFCPDGTAQSFGFHQAGRGRATTFHLFKTLTCNDSSDSLTIRVDASFVFGTPGTIGGWNVVGGTGNFAGTEGGGRLVGTSFPNGIDDVYTGRLTAGS